MRRPVILVLAAAALAVVAAGSFFAGIRWINSSAAEETQPFQPGCEGVNIRTAMGAMFQEGDKLGGAKELTKRLLQLQCEAFAAAYSVKLGIAANLYDDEGTLQSLKSVGEIWVLDPDRKLEGAGKELCKLDGHEAFGQLKLYEIKIFYVEKGLKGDDSPDGYVGCKLER